MLKKQVSINFLYYCLFIITYWLPLVGLYSRPFPSFTNRTPQFENDASVWQLAKLRTRRPMIQMHVSLILPLGSSQQGALCRQDICQFPRKQNP